MKRLNNKVAIVTGSSSGIGLQTCRRFVEEGATVVGLDLKSASADFAIHQIECDITSTAAVKAAVEEVIARYGKIDVVFANAGSPLNKPLDATTDDEFAHCFDVNVKGVFVLSREVLPYMKRQRSGSIIATASNAGLVGRINLPVYGAAKAAVVVMMKALSQGVGAYGIRANTICPGGVETPMLADIAKARAGAAVINPSRRLAVPDDIANAAIFLAGDESTYVTGIALSVDGGWVAGTRESQQLVESFWPE